MVLGSYDDLYWRQQKPSWSFKVAKINGNVKGSTRQGGSVKDSCYWECISSNVPSPGPGLVIAPQKGDSSCSNQTNDQRQQQQAPGHLANGGHWSNPDVVTDMFSSSAVISHNYSHIRSQETVSLSDDHDANLWAIIQTIFSKTKTTLSRLSGLGNPH